MKFSYKRLDELGSVSRGRSKHRPRNAPELYGGPYPFVQTADVKKAGLYLTEYSQTYSEKGLAQSKLWPKGTLCITIAANIADTAILGVDACFPDSVIGFISDDSKSNVKYVKYLFDYTLQTEFKKFSQGAAQDNLSQEKLLSIKLPVPYVEFQNRIVAILSDYDSAIDNARRQIALLEEAAMRLYREWFIVHADPKWEKRRLGEVIETIESGSRPRGGALKAGIPSIGAEKVNGVGIYDFTNEKYISEEFFRKMRRGVVKDNDVLLYKDGAYAGKVSMIVDGFPHTHAAINEHVFLLRTKEDLAQHYLYALLRQQDSYTYYNTVASAKAAQPGLNQDDVLDFEIWFPAVTTIEKYEQEVEPLFHCIGSKANKIKQLTEARDRLLPKLMSGEIEV